VSYEGALEVTEWREGEAIGLPRLALPRLEPGRSPAWRLIAALESDTYLLWGGEGGRGPGVLASVAGDGDLVELTDPAPQDARLRGWWPAAARDWQVDGLGRAYVGLAGPDSVCDPADRRRLSPRLELLALVGEPAKAYRSEGWRSAFDGDRHFGPLDTQVFDNERVPAPMSSHSSRGAAVRRRAPHGPVTLRFRAELHVARRL
jgi:hypothetical protein